MPTRSPTKSPTRPPTKSPSVGPTSFPTLGPTYPESLSDKTGLDKGYIVAIVVACLFLFALTAFYLAGKLRNEIEDEKIAREERIAKWDDHLHDRAGTINGVTAGATEMTTPAGGETAGGATADGAPAAITVVSVDDDSGHEDEDQSRGGEVGGASGGVVGMDGGDTEGVDVHIRDSNASASAANAAADPQSPSMVKMEEPPTQNPRANKEELV